MEFQILRPVKKVVNYGTQQHYGILFFDGDYLKLNIRTTQQIERHKKEKQLFEGLFYIIADILQNSFDLVVQLLRKVRHVVQHGNLHKEGKSEI
jgi:hypothetical protein